MDTAIAVATFFLYMVPWLVCHGFALWWLFKDRPTSEDGNFLIAMLVVLGVIPVINLWVVVRLFGEPVWDILQSKFKTWRKS